MKFSQTILITVTIVLIFSAVAQAQSVTKPCSAQLFIVAGGVQRLHFALGSFDCSSTQFMACVDRSAEIEDDCNYRGEDGGTVYSSCKCQGTRYLRQCMEEHNCGSGYSAILIENSPECFGIQ